MPSLLPPLRVRLAASWRLLPSAAILRGCPVLLVLLLLLLLHPSPAVGEITGLPVSPDPFCTTQCSSLKKCQQLFQSDSVTLQVKVSSSMLDGPGSTLIKHLFLGDVISLQTFDTQFVLDVTRALGISVCRVYVLDVSPGVSHHDWFASSALVTFALFPAAASDVVELTRQIQFPGEKIFDGNVTGGIDDLYGLVALKWDMTLKLTMALAVAGGEAVHAPPPAPPARTSTLVPVSSAPRTAPPTPSQPSATSS